MISIAVWRGASSRGGSKVLSDDGGRRGVMR